jgi:hypothetical protein
MTKIKILGTGCAKCKRFFANAEQAVKDLKIVVEVIKVEDLDEIVNRGGSCSPPRSSLTVKSLRKAGCLTWMRSRT